MFSSGQLAQAERYADLLATEGVTRGLIGPREVPRLWDRHLLNSAVLAAAIPDSASVADVGSGAGLPGLVLALARPDLTVALVEPLLRRTTFLEEVVHDLALTRVEVLRSRAEELHGRRRFDVVTSRAVAPLERLLGWSMPLVAPTGVMLALKGSSVAEELVAARAALTRLACAEPEILTLGEGVLERPTCAVRVAHRHPGQVTLPGADGPGVARRPGSARGRRR